MCGLLRAMSPEWSGMLTQLLEMGHFSAALWTISHNCNNTHNIICIGQYNIILYQVCTECVHVYVCTLSLFNQHSCGFYLVTMEIVPLFYLHGV